MKIEHFPGFICTIDESTGMITASVIPWENCEYIPAAVSRGYDDARHFPFPVKFLPRPKDNFFEASLRRNYSPAKCRSRTSLAVRTDVYPLLWILVWVRLHIENVQYLIWGNFMFYCNRLGLAKTPLGSHYSLRDFKIDLDKTLIITRSISSSIVVVSLWTGGYPIHACLWLLSWSFLQFTLWRISEKRRKLIEALKEVERVALARLRAMPERISPISFRTEYCKSCKYYHGDRFMVCAVHPLGYEGDYCKDRSDG